jgi:hypothetical protein
MTEKTPAELVAEQQARADRLEELFHADGRHQPTHPQRGLFTGLALQDPAPLPVVITEEETP